jgi:hypothetical protein
MFINKTKEVSVLVFGIILTLISLPAMLVPFIGIPMLIIGFVLILLGVGRSTANRTAKITAEEIARSNSAKGHSNLDSVEQIRKLDELRKSGLITDDEFVAKKRQILALDSD